MSIWQAGQQFITNLAAQFLLPVQNGGPQNAVIPMTGGVFTADGTNTVTVADTAVNAGSGILIMLKTAGGTVGAIPSVKTKTAGTGFTVSGTASDTSLYTYLILG